MSFVKNKTTTISILLTDTLKSRQGEKHHQRSHTENYSFRFPFLFCILRLIGSCLCVPDGPAVCSKPQASRLSLTLSLQDSCWHPRDVFHLGGSAPSDPQPAGGSVATVAGSIVLLSLWCSLFLESPPSHFRDPRNLGPAG